MMEPTVIENKLRIAVVDDAKESCRPIEMILSRNGYQVRVLGSIDEVIADLKNGNTYDLVMTDFHLGVDGNGSEALKIFKSAQSQIVCVLMSGDGDVDWQALGFDFFLLKPLDFAALPAQLRQLVKDT